MQSRNGVALSLMFACLVGCGTDSGNHHSDPTVLCDCATGGTTITVPAGLTATAVTVSGDACDSSDLSCSVQTSAQGVVTCVDGSYFVRSTRVGTCHIEVDLDGHAPFTRDVQFENADGCCNGIYPVNGDAVVTVEAS